jgi:hypothetical protein
MATIDEPSGFVAMGKRALSDVDEANGCQDRQEKNWEQQQDMEPAIHWRQSYTPLS